MCNFFSFVTDPINHPAEYYHFDWEYRKAHLDDDGADSHSHICAHFVLDEDRCNKYEFNPLTRKFVIDQINSERDDSKAAEKWAARLDFKTVVEPLIIKPIVKPFELPKVEKPTDEQIRWLKDWASVGASVRNLVGSLVWDLVGSPVWASVRSSVWAYFSSFFAIEYKFDFSSVANLWNAGLVPSFDGKVWRLHSGKSADIVYEWTPEVQESEATSCKFCGSNKRDLKKRKEAKI